jgi:hypothetical protein
VVAISASVAQFTSKIMASSKFVIPMRAFIAQFSSQIVEALSIFVLTHPANATKTFRSNDMAVSKWVGIHFICFFSYFLAHKFHIILNLFVYGYEVVFSLVEFLCKILEFNNFLLN